MVWQFLIDIIILNNSSNWQQLCGFSIIVTFSLIQISKIFCCDDTIAIEAQKKRNAVEEEGNISAVVNDENFKHVK